jgi:hypothetical protein
LAFLAGICGILQLFIVGGVLEAATNPTMKTALLSVLTATLLGFASIASGRPLDAADFTAILFATGLVAWTIEQYSRQPRVLNLARPIRLPVNLGVRHSEAQGSRLAA